MSSSRPRRDASPRFTRAAKGERIGRRARCRPTCSPVLTPAGSGGLPHRTREITVCHGELAPRRELLKMATASRPSLGFRHPPGHQRVFRERTQRVALPEAVAERPVALERAAERRSPRRFVGEVALDGATIEELGALLGRNRRRSAARGRTGRPPHGARRAAARAAASGAKRAPPRRHRPPRRGVRGGRSGRPVAAPRERERLRCRRSPVDGIDSSTRVGQARGGTRHRPVRSEHPGGEALLHAVDASDASASRSQARREAGRRDRVEHGPRLGLSRARTSEDRVTDRVGYSASPAPAPR